MKKNIKTQILKFVIIPSFILCMIFLVGCGTTTNNTLSNISLNMNKIIDSTNNIEVISTSELIIDDFMDENSIELIETTNSGRTETTDAMNLYLSKITLLNNSIYGAVQVNNEINNKKIQIIAKAHQVKSLSEQCKSEKSNLSNDNLDSLEELNNVVLGNSTRANLTRNEIKNNLKSINEIKSVYSTKTEQLSSRYQKLEGSLNTRLAYFNNILNGLDSMCNIISSNCSNYNPSTLEETDETKNLVENTKQTSKTSFFKKNIDSYENAGKDMYGFNKVDGNRYYNNDQYLNRYYNYNNGAMPYGNIYGNMYGYNMGMPYGYNMGMPFGYGNGYIFPNINTFGTYKNIDTYKPIPKPYIPQQPESQYEQNESNDSTEVETSTAPTQTKNAKPKFPRPRPKPYIPKHELDDILKPELENSDILTNEKNNLESFPRPMQKPFEYKDFKDKSATNTPKLDDKTQQTNQDITQEDGEDKFVSTIPDFSNELTLKPKIEKLEQ